MRRHITVDIVTSRLSEKGRTISSIIGLLFMAVFLGFLTWRIGVLALDSLNISERDSGPLAFPVYIFKALAFFGIFTATLEALRQIVEIVKLEPKTF